MPSINLLPWREEAKKKHQQEFFTLLGLIAGAVFFIVFLVGQLYQMQIDGQNARNNYLNQEIAVLDKLIGEIRTLREKKDALKSRMKVVSRLQKSRNVGTEVLNEIANIVPAGIYLVSIQRQGASIQIKGKSESNNHLANMVRNIESSALLTEPQIEEIVSAKDGPKLLSDFELIMKISGLEEVTPPKKGAKR